MFVALIGLGVWRADSGAHLGWKLSKRPWLLASREPIDRIPQKIRRAGKTLNCIADYGVNMVNDLSFVFGQSSRVDV